MGRRVSAGNKPPKAPTTGKPSATPAPRTGGQAITSAIDYYGVGVPEQAKPTRSDRYHGHGTGVPGQADPTP